MLELIIAALASFAIATFNVRVIAPLYNRKPFSCFYCMSAWSALFLSIFYLGNIQVLPAFVTAAAIHALAFIIYIKTN